MAAALASLLDAFPSVAGCEQQVREGAPEADPLGRGQLERPVGADLEVPAARGDVDAACLEAVVLPDLLDAEVRPAVQEGSQFASRIGEEVLGDQDGRGEILGQRREDRAEG